MAALDVKLKRITKIYHNGVSKGETAECRAHRCTVFLKCQCSPINVNCHVTLIISSETVSGVILVQSKDPIQHQGISLNVEGNVTLTTSSKSVGRIEALYSSVKPINLISLYIDIAKSGKLNAGQTEIPFEFSISPKSGKKVLYETYHGVYINIQYMIHCLVKRTMLSKDLTKDCEIILEYKTGETSVPKPIAFTITPGSLHNIKDVLSIFYRQVISKMQESKMLMFSNQFFSECLRAVLNNYNIVYYRRYLVNKHMQQILALHMKTNIPRFTIRGKLDSSCCCITKPFTGEIIIEKAEMAIRSIELQLLRVETVGCAEGYAQEATEIQNIEMGMGDVCHGLAIPIYMVFPRLFSCPTLETTNFKVEFEVNVVIVFEDDQLVMEKFPIKLTRF